MGREAGQSHNVRCLVRVGTEHDYVQRGWSVTRFERLEGKLGVWYHEFKCNR